MPSYTTFKTINNIGDTLLSDTLETNIIEYFKWSFLNIGAFFNHTLPQSGHFGGQLTRLRLADTKGYTQGKVWEGARKDWVWESGVEHSVQPIQISGIYVNGTFVPKSSTGQYQHTIDYPNGRIIFNTALATNTVVTCEHSPRYVQVYDPSVPWFRHLHMNSFRIDDSHYSLYGSGIYSLPPEQRVQLPALVIRVTPIEHSEGKEIGGLTRWVEKEVDFHVLAETDFEMKQMHDIIHDCYNKTLVLFNKKNIIRDQAFPLNSDGSLTSNPKTYPQLVAGTGVGGFEWKTAWFKNLRSFEGENNTNNLWYCVIRATIKTDSP